MPARQNQLVLDATALTSSGSGAAGPDATALAALGEIGFLDLSDDRTGLAFAALGRPGYEQQRADLARVPGPDPHYVL